MTQVLQRYVQNLVDLFEVVELDGTGAGSIQMGIAPSTAYIEVERIAYSGAGAGAIFSLYSGFVGAAGLREGTISGSARQFADETSLVRFPPNTPIFAGFTAGTASAQVPVFIQALAVIYRVIDLDAPGEGLVVGHGIAAHGDRLSRDPGGWN